MVVRARGDALVFEDIARGVRVKASYVDRELSKARLCKELSEFRPASERHLEAARRARERYSARPRGTPPSLWHEYERELVHARHRREHD